MAKSGKTSPGSGAKSETGQAEIERLSTDVLVPYARNSRTHSEFQVGQLAASIREFGFVNPVLIAPDNTIVAGHGRVLAAQMLGLKEVPCLRLTHLTEAQRRAYVIADNRLAESSGWDEAMLAIELGELKDIDFDVALLGFDTEELTSLMEYGTLDGPGESEDDNHYTNKVVSPVYTPKGERPPLKELFDRNKTASLIDEINKADLPSDVKEFMRLAAERHTVFNFRQIAEYYCHANATLQDLMERSGLIIIDYNKAIEYGFVHLTERLGQLADNERELTEDTDDDA